MRPAAWCALAAAGALLAAAQLGGEAGAQETLSKLARSPGFLSCVTALEFGVRADAAEVYVPRAAAAARDEDAVEPQSESVYVPSVPENTAPVPSLRKPEMRNCFQIREQPEMWNAKAQMIFWNFSRKYVSRRNKRLQHSSCHDRCRS